MNIHRPARFAACLAAMLAAVAGAGSALAFPDKPIQYIIPFAPGGESDLTARLQAQVFAAKYKQQMIVVNRPGAGGALIWGQLNNMTADGYTISGINLPHIVLQPLEGNVQYKTEDMTPVYFFQYTADAIVVPATSPFKTYQDLVREAKENPEKVTLAGSATFSANHMATERLSKLAGVKITYVPFKGTGDLVASVAGGHVSGAMSYLPFAIQQKGKMRMLAVATEQRHPVFPDTPTFRELGFNWVDGAYRGVAVPKPTPRDIQKRLSDIMYDINQDPAMRKQLTDGGFDLIDITLEKMPAFLAEKSRAYIEDAKAAGLLK
ncbi:MAG: tripartite tricarboxylate transporter substrate binding protein [Betaproteobacteria bacterium]|nr:MAG: tripartite tricarboxylate transporter substrate binding protein [Betaproteobacteria bacterium]